MIVDNVPGRTSCNIQPTLLLRLAELDTVVRVKEFPEDISPRGTVCHLAPPGVPVLSGDVPVTLPQMDANFCETSPGPVKVVLELMGVLGEARYRRTQVAPISLACSLNWACSQTLRSLVGLPTDKNDVRRCCARTDSRDDGRGSPAA